MPSPSRFSALALIVSLCLTACGGAGEDTAEGSVETPAVIEMVAAREGIDADAARTLVQDVVTLAGAAKRRDSTQGATAELSPARASFLRRAALARVWLTDVFEATHGMEALGPREPMLAEAMLSPKHVHPELHMLCQLIATPSGTDDDRDALLATAATETWKAKAKARFEPALARMRRYLRADDSGACKLMAKLLRFETQDADGVQLRVETRVFDLHACAKLDAAGVCTERRWVPEWVAEVETQTSTGFGEPFETRFGLHAVFVSQIIEAQPVDDPETLGKVRASIFEAWRAQQWEATLMDLRKRRAVRTARLAETP